MRHRHPVNIRHYDEAPLGVRVADSVTRFMGSWKFLIIQTIIVLFWFTANIYLLSRPFDPFPFILLNLLFSTQAAYAAPLILLAGNRQADKDRHTLEHAAQEADIADDQNKHILLEIQKLEQQILNLERKILDTVDEPDQQ